MQMIDQKCACEARKQAEQDKGWGWIIAAVMLVILFCEPVVEWIL